MLSTLAGHVNSFELPVTTPAPLLDIRLRRSTTTIAIDLVGDLDVSTAPELWETLGTVVLAEAEAVSKVEVDLSRLNYVDSTGLGCFVTAHKRCASAGISLHLRQPDVFLRRLFEITGLDDLFDVD